MDYFAPVSIGLPAILKVKKNNICIFEKVHKKVPENLKKIETDQKDYITVNFNQFLVNIFIRAQEIKKNVAKNEKLKKK